MDDGKFARGTRLADNGAEKNGRTQIAYCGGVFSREAMAGAIAMARYESALRKAARDHVRDRVFVVVLDSDGSAAEHRVLAPGESAIFGRHEQARIRHVSPDVSLRHVAIAVAPRSTQLDPLIRVWDLATDRPFKTEDGLLTEALTADGPVFATIGSVFLGVIPLSSLPTDLPLGTVALWNSLPDRDVISRVAVGSAVRPLQPPQSSFSGRTTHVTRISSVLPPEDCDPEVAIGALTLSTRMRSRKYRVSAEALERGILIGRYGRCLNVVGDIDNVSRVHLLLSQVGPDVIAIDTASTFGTFDQTSHPIESQVLGEEGELLLADSLLVEWKANKVPRA